MRRLFRPIAFALFLSAAAGCAASDDEPPAQVSQERLTRIKSAFTAAKTEDFKPIENIVDQATITGWNVDARDVRAYVWVLDNTNVYVISFEADTKAVLEGAPPSAANPHESFLLFLDPTADTSALTSAALYREDAKEWVQAATRVTTETHPAPPSVDGGVPATAPPIDLDGGAADATPDSSLDASVDASPDGGVIDGGPTDGGPTDATVDADVMTDAQKDAPADG